MNSHLLFLCDNHRISVMYNRIGVFPLSSQDSLFFFAWNFLPLVCTGDLLTFSRRQQNITKTKLLRLVNNAL